MRQAYGPKSYIIKKKETAVLIAAVSVFVSMCQKGLPSGDITC